MTNRACRPDIFWRREGDRPVMSRAVVSFWAPDYRHADASESLENSVDSPVRADAERPLSTLDFPMSSRFKNPAIANNDGRLRRFGSPFRRGRLVRFALSRLSRDCAPRVVPALTSKMKHPGCAAPSRWSVLHVTLPCRRRHASRICRKSVMQGPCKQGVPGTRLWSRRYRSQFGMLDECVGEMTGVVGRTSRINAETFSTTRP